MATEADGQVWAVIDGGLVVNTVVWDGVSDWTPPEGTILESLSDWPHVGIGWTYNAKATVNKFVDNRPTEELTDGSD
jgi:hypothetical protein